MSNMYILGISAFYHDSAAALIKDDEIIAAAHEERFTRIKHDSSFPSNAIKFCLNYGGVSLNEIEAIVFYDKPWLKFERLLETYCSFAPDGLNSFINAIPVWIKEKLFFRKFILDNLSEIEKIDKKKIKLLYTEHHLSHAASAFFVSPFREAAILTVDGVGEWATASISYGRDNQITILKEFHFPNSLGLLYSAFTYYLGFKVNSGEYKVMGLAPYGDPSSERVQNYIGLIKEKLIDLKEDGSFRINQEYFDYTTGLKMVKDKKWEKLFNIHKREPEKEILQEHCDLALSIQKVTEDIILMMAKETKRLTGSKFLCLAGGVALNCVANTKILESGIFEDIYIQPAAGDAGGALGASYAAYYIYFNQARKINSKFDEMQGSYLGPKFSDLDIELMARKYKAEYSNYEDFDKLCQVVSEFLAQGKVVGWFQGRMEWGPRALGNRSILADPRDKDMQKRVNLKVKFRESFRPFAPAVLVEDIQEYFEFAGPAPYMLLTANILKSRRKELPFGYHKMSISEKLYYHRSDLPAITHLDYSARLQTVHRETNSYFWQLLNAFKKQTGCSVLINTSFNVRGEPIVCTPEDAYGCFMKTDIDYLVINNFLFDKSKQSERTITKIFKKYELD